MVKYAVLCQEKQSKTCHSKKIEKKVECDNDVIIYKLHLNRIKLEFL